MIDQEYIDNLTIWCSYHNDYIYNEYNLDYIPSYIKLFNTSNLNISEDNINYLNPHFCEVCTFYYVWKNQIKSKYVGFCHYRRFFTDLGKNNIEKYNVHYQFSYNGICLKKCNWGAYDKEFFKFDQLYEYLKTLKYFDKKQLYKYFYDENTIIHIAWKISFIFTWDLFNKTCEIFFGFLKYIFDDFTNIEYYKNTYRDWGWISELVIGIIVALLCDNKKINYIDDYNLHIYTKCNNLNNTLKFIYKNNRTNTTLIILSDNEHLIEKINNNYNEFAYATNNINEINNYDNIIELQVNEYIKCLDPIEFRNGNYIIEKFNN